ncbi:S-layer homology domain-containing protein [Desulfallas thermosapovorans]|uniref:S-layer family protein n=1 Tax=Desulfallas thermosapovorans DSM 6562 TaxID=1121431 RepID=A0A5S4ZV39_9FIRM|nr:S-layer homology domain-containing protein [Desulfallas thermosapovorans]TYO96581.1 S-layer family protein [Desulfallas thermosapovorans DSM 6562]
MGKRSLLGKCMVISLALLLAMLFSGAALAGFSDVKADHWAANIIKTMSEKGIVSGYPDGTFKPNNTVSQVEAVCMAVRSMGLQAASQGSLPEITFPVPGYAENDVKLALQHGLIKDTDQFSAYSAANRAWVARLLVRMIGKESEAQEELLMPVFTDMSQIPDWAVYYVRVAQDYDLIAGYPDKSFKPYREVTRAEMVSFLSRAMDKLPGTGGVAGNTGSVGVQQAAGTVKGLIVKVYPEIGAFVVEEAGGNLRTLYLPENASISVVGSSSQGLNALQPGDEVSVGLDSRGYVISISVTDRSGYPGTEGTVFDLDLDNMLLTLQLNDNRLQPYRLGKYVNVTAPGVRFPSLNDIITGDRVKVTVEGSEVIGIEILEVASRLTVTGKVITLNTAMNFVNLEVDGRMHVYSLPASVQVNISGMTNAYISDVQEGDTVTATINNGEITSLTVTGRRGDNDLNATIMAVDTVNDRVTLKDRNGKINVYDVLSNARIIIDDDDDAELSDLKQDMDVKFRLKDGDIIYLETDNKVGGIITSIDADSLIMEFQRDNGERKTYFIAKSADVNSKDNRDDIDEIRRGEYAYLTLSGDKVLEIDLKSTIIYRVERVRDSVDRLDVVDDDDDSDRLYIRSGVKLIIPGITYPGVSDVKEGDLVRAVFSGDDLKSVEVLEPLYGQVTFIDTARSTVTLQLFNGRTTTLDFRNRSMVNDGGRTYSNLSALTTGDRVEVIENSDGGYVFRVMEEVSSKLAFSAERDADSIYLVKGNSWERYNLHSDVYIHNASGKTLGKGDLKSGYRVVIYTFRDMVYEVVVE